MMFVKKKRGDLASDPKKEYSCELSLMILGCTHSGKSTVMHQFQLISDETSIDKKHFQRVIYGNTMATVLHLLSVVEKLGLELSADNKERVGRIKALPTTSSEFRLSRFPLKVVYDIKCIWEDEAVKAAYAHSLRDTDDTIVGRPEYYMQNLFRIFSPDFKPEELDVLSAYEQVDVTQNAEVVYRKVKLTVHSLPGDASDNRRWDSLSVSPDVVIYSVNLSNFDNTSAQTHIKFSLETLEHMSQNWEPFGKSHCVVLLLCYKDLFLEKSATVDLKCSFPEYEGGTNPEKALAFVTDLFTKTVVNKCASLRVHTTNALDRTTCSTVLDDLMDTLAPEISKRNEANANNRLAGSTNGLLAAEHRERRDSLSKEQKEKEKENRKKKTKGVTKMESGFESLQGRRKNMEDTHVIFDDFRVLYPSYSHIQGQCGYYGVYDGHGGAETSKQLEQLLHKNILEDPDCVAGNWEAGLKNAFKTTDSFVVTQPWKSGSTAVISLIVGEQLIVANAGDSEAILGRLVGTGKKAKIEHVVLSYKHLPTEEQEKQRITALGGLVVFGRLFGSLAVSRSFGDKEFKDGPHFVSSEPHIRMLELTPTDQFIVMACDGLWDKLSYDEVVNSVMRLRKEGKTATDISKALAQEALDKDSMDNVTVVVVFLQWKK